MAEPTKPGAGAEAASAPRESPASGEYRLKGLGKQKEVAVPLTGRTYKLDTISQPELQQLHELGWPHVELVP